LLLGFYDSWFVDRGWVDLIVTGHIDYWTMRLLFMLMFTLLFRRAVTIVVCGERQWVVKTTIIYVTFI